MHQELAVVVFDALDVFRDQVTPAEDLDGINQPGVERLNGMRSEDHPLHELSHTLARLAAPLFSAGAFGNLEAHRVEDRHRDPR